MKKVDKKATKRKLSKRILDGELTLQETLDITRRVYMETLRHQRDVINRLNANLTATQERCNELLKETRSQRRVIAELQQRFDQLDEDFVVDDNGPGMDSSGILEGYPMDGDPLTDDEVPTLTPELAAVLYPDLEDEVVDVRTGSSLNVEGHPAERPLAPPYADPFAVIDGARPPRQQTPTEPVLTPDEAASLLKVMDEPKLPPEAVQSPHVQPPFSPRQGRWRRGMVMDR